MIKYRVHENTRREREREEVRHGVVDCQVKRGVFVVRSDVERVVLDVQDASYVVWHSVSIVWRLAHYGEMRKVPHLIV